MWFCFSFHQPPGLCLSCLSFSSSSDLAWFMRECLTGGRAFVHGHTFLHSWTHFLAFMDTLSCIHGHTFLHSWTHFLAFMDTLSCSWTHFLAFMDTLSCIHGHTFLHSWTHFLAFMEWADDIGSLPAAWSYVPDNLTLDLFVSLMGPQQLERTLIKPRIL